MSVTPGGMPKYSFDCESLKEFVGQVCTVAVLNCGLHEGRLEKIENGLVFLVEKKGATYAFHSKYILFIMKKP